MNDLGDGLKTDPNVQTTPGAGGAGDVGDADKAGGNEKTPSPGSSAVVSTAPGSGGPAVGGPQAPSLEPPKVSADGGMGALMLMLTKLQAQQSQSNMKGMVKSIHNNVTAKSTERKAQADALKKSHDAMDKAKKAGVFGKKFGWLGTVLTVVAAAAVAVLLPGIGVGLAALMIGGLILNAVMKIPAVHDYLQSKLGDKGMMALTIGIAVAQVIGAIALTVCTGGAGGVAVAAEVEEISTEAALDTTEVTAEAGADATETGADASGDLDTEGEGQVDPESEGEPEVEDNYDYEGDDSMNNDDEGGEPGGKTRLQKLQTGARIVRGSSQMSKAAFKTTEDVQDIKVAGYQQDAGLAKADAVAHKAEIRKLAAQNEQTQNLLQTLIKRLEEVFSTCAQTISDEHATDMKIAQGMSTTHTA